MIFVDNETVEHLLNILCHSYQLFAEVNQNTLQSIVYVRSLERDITEKQTFMVEWHWYQILHVVCCMLYVVFFLWMVNAEYWQIPTFLLRSQH